MSLCLEDPMLDNLIIPVLNRYDLLQRCLMSIDFPVKHLLIIDNGSSNNPVDTEVAISDYVEMTTYLPMPANLGVAASWNLGIKSFPHDDRWFFASNDVEFGPGALQQLSEARTDEITLSKGFPFWQVFSLGYEAVSRLGLFDEGFYPAYFEDNDYQRRADAAGVPIRKLDLLLEHDNSSTIRSSSLYTERNDRSFRNNQIYFGEKELNDDYSAGGWSVSRRRQNSWD
jgi:GT2 family glycosyltransferase